jgi:dTDP-4-amino-4,6-dideoxygalactose transaminase
MIPVMKPQLPTAAQLRPYLDRIDSARYYSNHGPLVREFEARLGIHFGVSASQVCTSSNGTTALSAALIASNAAPGSKCLLPSWTFVASAAAVWAAHLRPHFVDVSEKTWALEPAALLQRSDLNEVGVVMVVSPFGAPIDVESWDAFHDETGIPVVIDAAAGFDTAAVVPHARPGRSATMVSFHATKVFGIGEGAAVLSLDEELVSRVHQICNFGFSDKAEGQVLGYNGKLSEYHAAVGLAMFDEWPSRRATVSKLTDRYASRIRAHDATLTVPSFGDGWLSCYCNVLVVETAEALANRFHAQGIETRRWWRNGVHRQPAYRDCARDELPITEKLAEHVIGLPFFHDLALDDVETIVHALDVRSRIRV